MPSTQRDFLCLSRGVDSCQSGGVRVVDFPVAVDALLEEVPHLGDYKRMTEKRFFE
ncbi:hypothetical protein RER_40210 [Rhodococcus erythropolis PR4]|uniref:Uncharacterized protein n=1 Tax=Rhodococcus erythropolis (strain PR4 / NBRC 100887) TaxID=234621 RepID=C1A294_RHOE4|nr:hypothetical protein RER_40210 [Rhodococcus erythropolis PR4]